VYAVSRRGCPTEANKMPGIVATMTVKEAAEYLAEPGKKKDLQRWAETFGIPLHEFHIGHIRTYQTDRSHEVEATIVDREVAALLTLLRELNISAEIERLYQPLADPVGLKVKKADDGRCLFREHFVKKDHTLSKITRQCSRQAKVHDDGRINRFCPEHQKEFNETFLRAMDRDRPRITYVRGPRTIQ
jgi:hypothetical protein